jgi:putative DNA primase/helicase
MRVWNEGGAVQPGDAVDTYLRNRGIILSVYPDSIRLHPALGYWHEKELIGTFPAMLARVTSAAGELVSVHRTYLTESGTKADVPQPRKLMSPALSGGSRGGAIRLFPESKVLAVGEGIETCLAVHSAKGYSVWCTISAVGMASLVVPGSVETVIICADKDASGAGEHAAQKLAERLYRDGKNVSIALPPGPSVGKSVDWLDVLRNHANHGQ